MNRWLWFLPLGALTLTAGLVGLRFGWHVATLSETDVITRFADRYAREDGAEMSDCFAEPGEAYGVWIVVRCVPSDRTGKIRSYFVNRFGGLAAQDQMERAPAGGVTVARPET